MKILITGVNGFIGKALVSYLSKENMIIYGTGLEEKFLGKESINYIQSNLGSDEFLKEFKEVKKIDIIIHCAAIIDYSNHNSNLIKVNCYGIFNIIELAKLTNTQKIIYISSIQIVKKNNNILTEKETLDPPTLYHTTKIFGEQYLKNIKDIEKFILRISSPVGKGMPKDKILSTFVKKSYFNEKIRILGRGKRVQNYINVKDIAEVIRKIIVEEREEGVYNIASPTSISNFELAKLCKKTLNSTSEIYFEGVDKEENDIWNIDISKAKEKLNFLPKISLEETILEISEGNKK